MENLKPLFDERDNFFSVKTLEIFSKINNTLTCVTFYLNNADDIISQGRVTWEDITLVDDMVVVMGSVEYDPGSVVSFEGEITTITEENVDLFQRVVHMSLPLHLVEENNEDNITTFLNELGEGQDIDNFSNLIAIPPVVDGEDFDLSDLSEEQLESLKHSPKTRSN